MSKWYTNNWRIKFQTVIFIFGYAMSQKKVKVTPLFKRFLVYLFVVRQSGCHFWKLGTKLDRPGMFFFYENFGFKFERYWPDLLSNVKMSATIEFYVTIDP